MALGDADERFCVQSTCKPINYCLALDEQAPEKVHSHVGREPSGRGFNELALNHDGRPHNPMINAGAIMTCSLIKPELDVADRFDHVMQRWSDTLVVQSLRLVTPFTSLSAKLLTEISRWVISCVSTRHSQMVQS